MLPMGAYPLLMDLFVQAMGVEAGPGLRFSPWHNGCSGTRPTAGECPGMTWIGNEGSLSMVDRDTWDWDAAKKLVSDLRAVQGRFDQVHEWAVSADGERIAAPVLTAPEVFRVWVNDSLWEGEYESTIRSGRASTKRPGTWRSPPTGGSPLS